MEGCILVIYIILCIYNVVQFNHIRLEQIGLIELSIHKSAGASEFGLSGYCCCLK